MLDRACAALADGDVWLTLLFSAGAGLALAILTRAVM